MSSFNSIKIFGYSSSFIPYDINVNLLDIENPNLFRNLGYVPWEINEKWNVEFFPGIIVSVQLVSIDNHNLEEILKSYVDDNPIAMDLEWKPDLNDTSNNPIALFQFCTTRGAIIVKGSRNNDKVIYRFLKSHKFFMKGAIFDILKLRDCFGRNFTFDFEDIQDTRLLPYGFSTNFSKMIMNFAGTPTVEFKDRYISVSNWDAEVLSKKQVLYSAFDVVGLYQCYHNFYPPKRPEKLSVIQFQKIKGVPSICRNPSNNYFLINGLGKNHNQMQIRGRLECLKFFNGLIFFKQNAIFISNSYVSPEAVSGILKIFGFKNNALIVFSR